MNLNKYLLIGTLSVIATNALAEGQNIMTSKSYVDAQDALKQDVITTGLVEFNNNEDYMLRSIVTSNAAGTALNGNTIGILDYETVREDEGVLILYSNQGGGYGAEMDNFVPTVRAVAEGLEALWNEKQIKIPKSGYNMNGGVGAYNTNAATDNTSWLNANVAGTGLVTRTSNDGRVGERKIFEASSLSGYSALTGNNKLIADISIPTVGAMMSAISNGITAAAPTGTANTIANYDANGDLGTGIATANAPAYTSGSLTNGTNIATIAAVDTREAKMTCAGWPESVAVADRTDANCWLWQRN